MFVVVVVISSKRTCLRVSPTKKILFIQNSNESDNFNDNEN